MSESFDELKIRIDGLEKKIKDIEGLLGDLTNLSEHIVKFLRKDSNFNFNKKEESKHVEWN